LSNFEPATTFRDECKSLPARRIGVNVAIEDGAAGFDAREEFPKSRMLHDFSRPLPRSFANS
jgi:hypothetical protein